MTDERLMRAEQIIANRIADTEGTGS